MKNIYFILFFLNGFSGFAHAQCNTEIGTLPTDTLFICENSIEIISHEDYILGENDALIYVLHTENGLEEIIDTFPSNEIAWQGLGKVNWNNVYFVSAIGGIDSDLDGLPDDLNDECTVVSNALPVVFAAFASFSYSYECNDTFVDSLCQYIVDVDWRFWEGFGHEGGNLKRQFFITNSFLEDTISFEYWTSFEFRVVDFEQPLMIDFQIFDAYDCMNQVFSFDVYNDCIEPVLSSDFATISDMPSELKVICDGAESYIQVGCVYNMSFFNPSYSLSLDSIYNPNSILATSNNEGQFTSQDAEPYLNQILYVFGKINDFWGNTNYTTESTPIVFLKPLEINIHTLDCNSTTGMATLEIAPIGGLPEFDENAFYSIEGTIENTLQFGESQIVEVPFSESMEWELNVSISDGNGCEETIVRGEACVVGIENQETSHFYLQKLFPNPTSDLLNLQINVSQNQPLSLQLWDLKGNKVLQEYRHLSVGSQHLTLKVGQLPVGVYYLRIVGEKGIDFRKVMVL